VTGQLGSKLVEAVEDEVSVAIVPVETVLGIVRITLGLALVLPLLRPLLLIGYCSAGGSLELLVGRGYRLTRRDVMDLGGAMVFGSRSSIYDAGASSLGFTVKVEPDLARSSINQPSRLSMRQKSQRAVVKMVYF
jgi:hypothetical protein